MTCTCRAIYSTDPLQEQDKSRTRARMDEEQEASLLKKTTSSTLPMTLTSSNVTPVTRLLEKRKQLLSIQAALDSQKTEYAHKEQAFKRREENLRKKDLELQESLVLFNKFLKENEQKRRRAEQRAHEEIKKRIKWEKEIVNRKQILEKLKSKCEKLKRQVRKNEKYHMYLQSVYDDPSSHFDELSSILSRHSTLTATHQSLLATQHALLRKQEETRAGYTNMRKEGYDRIMRMGNGVATASHDVEQRGEEIRELEERRWIDEDLSNQRIREMTQMVMATENIHQRCRRMLQGIRRHGAHRLSAKERERLSATEIITEETSMKLNEIADYIVDLQDIVESIAGVSLDPSRGKSNTHHHSKNPGALYRMHLGGNNNNSSNSSSSNGYGSTAALGSSGMGSGTGSSSMNASFSGAADGSGGASGGASGPGSASTSAHTSAARFA